MIFSMAALETIICPVAPETTRCSAKAEQTASTADQAPISYMAAFGSDRLSGGSGSDVFVFKGHWGHDRIDDFHNDDKIDLRGNGFSFASLKIGAADVDNDGRYDDVLIQTHGQSIGLVNTAASSIDRGDFWL